MDFRILSAKVAPEDCALFEMPRDFPYPILPAEGEPMGERYARRERFRMAAQVPGKRVPDSINNAFGYWMISGRLKSLLEEHSSARIEFLPFTLVNHKGRDEAAACWIANVLERVDCVDPDRTEGTPHALLDGQLQDIRRLVLDPARIPAELDLFRIAARPRVLIVRDDLRAMLEREQATGVEFLALGSPVRLG